MCVKLREYSTHRALRMTVGFFVPTPPWAGWSPPGPSRSSITPISASGSLREASIARMDGCLWMLGYGWVQDAAMAARLGRGETTEGLGDNADCRGRSSNPVQLFREEPNGLRSSPNEQNSSGARSTSVQQRTARGFNDSTTLVERHYLAFLSANRFPSLTRSLAHLLAI